ncbi:Uncharacterized protein Adt_07973 [Abeliophyllum distichum]|uniref:Uncharacterized protein n=1 Tax=Abeliophyllum distichum TaxID=126358 RepID=A0ABD1VBM1_9LAMI
MQYRNKSSVVMAKSLNERKDEHLVGDDANPRKKSKRESDQHANVKKIRPEVQWIWMTIRPLVGILVERNFFKEEKVEGFQGSQGNLPTLLSNGSGLQNSEVSVKEESSNSGFQREKKPRVSQIDVKEFSKSKDNNIPKSKSTANRILLSGNRENPIDRSIEKERQVRKYRAKLPLQLTWMI